MTAAAALLAKMPGTAKQLRQRTELPLGTVTDRLHKLREDGECHIGGWDDTHPDGRPRAIYYAGPGEDAPAPPPRSKAAMNVAKRARMLARLEARDQMDDFLRTRCGYEQARRARLRAKARLWAAPLFVIPRPYY